MRLRLTSRGKKALKKLDPQQRKQAEEALSRFLTDPRSPGLHFEKLQGKEGLHTIRFSLGFRIYLRSTSEGDLFEIVDAGPHDLYDRIR